MEIWVYAITASLAVSSVAFSGVFTLFMSDNQLKRFVPFLVSLAVGVLLGDAFIHLIPDAAVRLNSVTEIGLFTSVGIVLFFLIEKVVRWRHDHDLPSVKQEAVSPSARMNLIGDAVHNFVDGMLIAGSFYSSPALGVTTTLAIIIHEIPQEIGDVGSLIFGGYTPRRAIWLNFLCTLPCVLGVVATLVFGVLFEGALVYLLPLAAGGFIYIAVSDFMPMLHYRTAMTAHFAQVFLMATGIGAMEAVTLIERMLT